MRALAVAAAPSAAARFSGESNKEPKPLTGEEEWMDFNDDDFWFLDEMFEGRLESPEFLPDHERRLLEREGLDGDDSAKKQ